jgi:hypothetical protein
VIDMIPLHDAVPVAATAIRLRDRIRALAVAQEEASDLCSRQFAGGSFAGDGITRSTGRLSFLAMLLADLAWTHGDHEAHDASPPSPAAEAVELKRVHRVWKSPRRQCSMSLEQRLAVLAYLDALLSEASCCLALEEHAPSGTLGREARRLVQDLSEGRKAVALL